MVEQIDMSAAGRARSKLLGKLVEENIHEGFLLALEYALEHKEWKRAEKAVSVTDQLPRTNFKKEKK